MKNVDEIIAHCDNVLPGHGARQPLKTTLLELAASLGEDEYPDQYGSGEAISAFEAEVARLFGKEASVFMPTGTMAQQIALRIWCEAGNNFTVAMHPTAHPSFAEHASFSFLHRINRLQFGAPEFVGDRLLTVNDFESLGQTPGVVLLELPYRPLGGLLPGWDDLVATREWATAHGIPMHMDGARIWSCRPF